MSADADAFDAFVRARMPSLLRFAHALTGDPHTAADLVQDALVRTGMRWSRLDHTGDPEAYVRRAILNRSEEHTSELQSHVNLVCRLLLEKKKKTGPKSATVITC